MRIRETSNWKENYNDGRVFYNNQDYENALSSYRAALISTNPAPPESEKPILLSNSVACRLKIGGAAQSDAALEEALQCVALNPRWSKGHVRLASVYICLKRSNDACNSLQRAISLDPTNQNAKSMLMKELRRDTAPSAQYNNNPYANASAPTDSPDMPSSSGTYGNNGNDHNTPFDGTDTNNNTDAYADIDDLPSLRERYTQKFFLYIDRIKEMYVNSNEDTQSFIKAFFFLLCLYVAFGGRFGLDSLVGSSPKTASNSYSYSKTSNNNMGSQRRTQQTYSTSYTSPGRGNYEQGNAYDQYYRNANRQSSNYDTYSTSSPSYSSFVFDGGFGSIITIFGIVYIVKLLGGADINPWHVFWMLRMMGNRNRMGGFGGYRRGMWMGRGYGRPGYRRGAFF